MPIRRHFDGHVAKLSHDLKKDFVTTKTRPKTLRIDLVLGAGRGLLGGARHYLNAKSPPQIVKNSALELKKRAPNQTRTHRDIPALDFNGDHRTKGSRPEGLAADSSQASYDLEVSRKKQTKQAHALPLAFVRALSLILT